MCNATEDDCSNRTELELEPARGTDAPQRADVARGPTGVLDVADLEVGEGEAIERGEAAGVEALDQRRAGRVRRRAEEGERGERLVAERVEDRGTAEGPVERQLAQVDAALERVVERAGMRYWIVSKSEASADARC